MTKNFQVIVTGIFLLFVVIGVIVFATSSRRGDGGADGPIVATVGGTIDEASVREVVKRINLERDKPATITYRELRPEEFDRALVEAIAEGEGPDAIFLPQDLITRYRGKIIPIPYKSISERTFKDTYVEEAELYLNADGVLALPVLLDPLVLFWNRTVFSNDGVAQPPQYWDELYLLAERLTKRDAAGNIAESMIPFGEFGNVANAKEVLATLILQAGNPIIAESGGTFSAVLTERFGYPVSPAESALLFYTDFSNPAKSSYSWNRALPLSTDAFIAGDVALYPGFASELFTLREQNPNLNFDVALLPQVRDGDVRRTFGQMYGLAVLKSSPNQGGGFSAAVLLAGKDAAAVWEEVIGLPPARRDLLSRAQNDAFRSVFYKSALIAGAFRDPDPDASEAVFRRMVEGVVSGRLRIAEAVRQANAELARLIQ